MSPYKQLYYVLKDTIKMIFLYGKSKDTYIITLTTFASKQQIRKQKLKKLNGNIT